MTDPRIKLAHHIFDNMAPKPEAFVIGGSVGRGHSDSYSDLEILTFWRDRPDKAEETDLSTGCQIDFEHRSIAETERVIQDVIVHHDLTLSKHCLISSIIHCIPIAGNVLIEGWQAKAASPPHELAKKIVEEQILFFSDGNCEIHLRRDDLSSLYIFATGLQKRVFLALLALNRSWFSGFKRMPLQLAEMSRTPKNASRRFKDLYRLPPEKLPEELESLMTETLQLIRQEFPELPLEETIRRITERRSVSPPKL